MSDPTITDSAVDTASVTKKGVIGSAVAGTIGLAKGAVHVAGDAGHFLKEVAVASMGVNSYGTNVDGPIDAGEVAGAVKEGVVKTAHFTGEAATAVKEGVVATPGVVMEGAHHTVDAAEVGAGVNS